MVGLSIALIGVFLSQQLQNPYLDGAASVSIGVLLLIVATFLAKESKGLLLGESADPAVIASVEKIMKEHPSVKDWTLPQTMHFGPESVLMVVEIDLIDNMELLEAEKTMLAIRDEIQSQEPTITKVFIQSSNNLHPKLI